MIDERLTTDIHIPLTPSLRQQIDDLARAEALKPATVARRPLLAGLAAQKANDVARFHDALRRGVNDEVHLQDAGHCAGSRAQAQDGDTIRLVWPGANGFSKASVESRAVALGLDVVIEVRPERAAEIAR